MIGQPFREGGKDRMSQYSKNPLHAERVLPKPFYFQTQLAFWTHRFSENFSTRFASCPLDAPLSMRFRHSKESGYLFSKMLSSMIESLEPGPNVSDYYYKTMVVRGRAGKVSGGWLAGKREWRFGPDAEKSARLGQGFGRRQPI
ncbi:hypothetical protein [Hydrogenispora ethanolica]|uniref:hypothetical protein n=1 Tax=Hydrogenispora ethanolica TaxID=1082276 RepID=UPI0010539FA7|nr:hypothetical protein [Hydrogenispora ethanolica]